MTSSQVIEYRERLTLTPLTTPYVSFGPSRLVFATTTSADFLPFVVTTVLPLTRTPQVRAFSFTPYIRHLYKVCSV